MPPESVQKRKELGRLKELTQNRVLRTDTDEKIAKAKVILDHKIATVEDLKNDPKKFYAYIDNLRVIFEEELGSDITHGQICNYFIIPFINNLTSHYSAEFQNPIFLPLNAIRSESRAAIPVAELAAMQPGVSAPLATRVRDSVALIKSLAIREESFKLYQIEGLLSDSTLDTLKPEDVLDPELFDFDSLMGDDQRGSETNRNPQFCAQLLKFCKFLNSEDQRTDSLRCIHKTILKKVAECTDEEAVKDLIKEFPPL